MKKKLNKISYNVKRWDSSGFCYKQTVTISNEDFIKIVNSFKSENKDIEIRLNSEIERIKEGYFTNLSQAAFIAEKLGLKIKDGYNTFFKVTK